MLEKLLKAILLICALGLICGRIMINHGANHQNMIMLECGIMLNLWLLMPRLFSGLLVLAIEPLPLGGNHA